MIVVADTSPLNYLIQIECAQILPRLYQRILIPPAVMDELNRPGTPAAVRAWLHQKPAWIEVGALVLTPQEELASLDRGEREAIQLAEEQQADVLLIDERKGQRMAERRGLSTTGTLGVLLSAEAKHWIDAEFAYRRLLRETTFRTSAVLEAQFLGRLRPAAEDTP